MDVHPSQLDNPENRNYWPANRPLAALRHHVTGAIERGEKEAIVEMPAKVDRATFNYGRALGVTKAIEPEYRALEAQARAWADIAAQFSRAAWALEMGLKATRDAEDIQEQLSALQGARATFLHQDRKLERVESGPCKWFRYGRIGNVLKAFSWTSRHNA